VWRKDEVLRLDATIAESGTALAPSQPPSSSAGLGRTHDPDEVLKALGIQVRDLSDLERQRGYRGVRVTGITENGLATDKVKAGDIIIAVNNSAIRTASEFFLYLAASAAVQETTLHVVRDGQIIRVGLAALPRQE
jgi:type II secretory pathway component PulC